MASTRSPSPSPPPQAPSQSQPVIGHRAAQLQKVFTSALRATLASNSYENFSACFPTPAAYCPTALEGVWRQLNTRLEKECLEDFEKICAERNVVDNLNELERVIDGAKLRKLQVDDGDKAQNAVERPIHTLSAKELHNVHVAAAMLQAEKGLKDKLEAVHDSNRDKAAQVQRQRQEIEEMLTKMESRVTDVEDAARVLEQDAVRSDIQRELAILNEADTKMTD